MPKTQKTFKRKTTSASAAAKRDLREQLKLPRATVAQAEEVADDLTKIKTDVGHAIAPIIDKLQTFEKRLLQMEDSLQAFEKSLLQMEGSFHDRVKQVADTIVDNLRFNNGRGARTAENSGTMKSTLGRVADEGIYGVRLSGSFESKSR